MAVPSITSGNAAADRYPRSSAPSGYRIALPSASMSLQTTGMRFSIACAPRPGLPCPCAATVGRVSCTNPRSSPAHATAFTRWSRGSAVATHASGNCPESTAIRHASRKSSSRSLTLTIVVLMPLSTAYTRFRRLIFSSASARSVMSSPMLAVPMTSPEAARSTVLFQRISRWSPLRVRISFS